MGYDSLRASVLNQPSSSTCDFLDWGKGHGVALMRILIFVSLLLLEFNVLGSIEEVEHLISTKGQIVFEDDFELKWPVFGKVENGL